ncbi:MAG: DUF4911 domain-containing protein [Desulfovibrionaceae bacterium]|nr:DUF4911 domain-containing protein [Desulfovibrionaceae bacterium]
MLLSKYTYLRLPPSQVGYFRFLLEAYENVAYFTVVDRHAAWIRLVYTREMESQFRSVLAEIAETIECTGRIDDC